MTISYNSIVPWGRSFEEYTTMFSLSDADLKLRILGCGDGPASFNAEMARRGTPMTSIDPIYEIDTDQIRMRIHETYEDVINQTQANRNHFIWTRIKNVDELGRIRMTAMNQFLDDFDQGKKENRYIPGELPQLPFKSKSFDLALCSHFLFLYTDNLSLDFHIRAIKEMRRVANEIRIFPLQNYNAERSPYLDDVIKTFLERGDLVEEIKVDYEFQKGSNHMLRIKKQSPNTNTLQSLPNIGKVTAKKLMQIGIFTKEDFLSRDPYQVFDELLKKIDPTLCRCALAGIVGAKEDKPWHAVTKQAAIEFDKRYPEHQWKDKC